MSFGDPKHPLWAILANLISYIPAVFALVLITNSWDQEWLVIAALAAGAGGKALFDNLKPKESSDGS